jgi:peptide deformylase
MLLKLVTVPDPILRQVSQPVTGMNNKNVQFLKDMANTLIKKEDPPGVGLSAIQVGTPARIFMTYLPPLNDLDTLDDQQPPQELKIFINPEIVDQSEKLTLGPDKKHPALEGCLSIPNLYGPVPRHQTIKIKYFSPQSEVLSLKSPLTQDLRTNTYDLIEHTEVFSHFFARVIQHEFDHLEGILFTDYTLKHSLPLYFDNGKNLTEIPLPEKLIQW